LSSAPPAPAAATSSAPSVPRAKRSASSSISRHFGSFSLIPPPTASARSGEQFWLTLPNRNHCLILPCLTSSGAYMRTCTPHQPTCGGWTAVGGTRVRSLPSPGPEYKSSFGHMPVFSDTSDLDSSIHSTTRSHLKTEKEEKKKKKIKMEKEAAPKQSEHTHPALPDVFPCLA
jgi:hypothetical protein